MTTRTDLFQQHLDKCSLCGNHLELCGIGLVLLQLVSEEALRKIEVKLKKLPIVELAKSRAAIGFLKYMQDSFLLGPLTTRVLDAPGIPEKTERTL